MYIQNIKSLGLVVPHKKMFSLITILCKTCDPRALPTGRGHFMLQELNLNKLGRGLLGDARGII